MKQGCNYIIILLVFFSEWLPSQNASLHVKTWVKKNTVLLRWVPVNKEIFEFGRKNGYKISRTDDNGIEVVIAESIKPYSKDDPSWKQIMKSSPSAPVIFMGLFNNSSKETDMQKKKEQELMVYNLMLLSCDFDAALAKSCGLFFEDNGINNVSKYKYKISAGKNAQGKIIETEINVYSNELSVHPQIKNLEGFFKIKQVKLRWKAADFNQDFAAYQVERSIDNRVFEKINKSPVILLTSQFEKNKKMLYYLDTFPQLKKKCYYRIRGINHFGELSEPSNIVEGIGYDALKSYPVFDTIYTIKNETVFMKWKMSDSSENKIPLSYFISRAVKDAGPYEIIHNTKPDRNEYTDLHPLSSGFYKIAAIGFGGDTITSFSHMILIIDTIPPQTPTGLKGKVDPKGHVTLSWDKNPESDIQGYKIFRSNALHEEFVQINNDFAVQPEFKDKLNLKTLTKDVFYKVSAADNRYNNSPQSDYIVLKRPDTIPPVAPIITKLDIQLDRINVNWINSTSNDISYNVLYRTEENTLTEIKLFEWKKKDSVYFYSDTTVVPGWGYYYKILSSDEDDNISLSNRSYMLFETGYRKKLTDITFTVDRSLKQISLKWNYTEKGVEKYLIYRCKKDGQPTIVKTLDVKENEFTDKTISIGNLYEYRIKPVFANGAEGIISDRVVVEY